jgi:hypothetical protein
MNKLKEERERKRVKEGDRESSDFEESDEDGQDKDNENKALKNDLSPSQKNELLEQYCSMICYTLIKKISVKLYLEDESENKSKIYNPFVELLLNETQTVFTKKLNLTNETRIVIADMELLEIQNINKNKYKNEKMNEGSKFKILSEFTQNIITGEIEDYENDIINNIEEQRKLIKRKTLRESTVKEEKIFKTIIEDVKKKDITRSLMSKLRQNKSNKNVLNFASEEKDNIFNSNI